MLRTTHFSVIAVAVTVFAVAALASLAYASNADESPPAGEATALAQAADSTPASLEPEMSDYQKAILADGEVTDAEMEAAVRETVACLRSQGWNAEFIPQEVAWAPPTLRIVSSHGGSTVAAATVPCQDLYMSELGTTFALNRAPKDATFGPDEHIRRVEACLVEKGFPLNERYENSWHPDRKGELSATPGGVAAFEACVTQIASERFPATPSP